MPTTFAIDAAHRRVIFRFSGAFTVAEMAAVRQRVKDDPAFDVAFDQITDLRDVTDFGMSSDQLRQTARQSVFNQQARIALVVARDNPVTFGMVRMYELMRNAGDPDRVGIFDTVEDAAVWLDTPRPSAP